MNPALCSALGVVGVMPLSSGTLWLCREKDRHERHSTQAAPPTVREAVQQGQGLALDVPKKLFC